MMNAAAAIQVDSLSKHYGPLRAVDDLTFAVEYGNVVGFVGPNGAGKTTTLRSIVGHVTADSGRALVAGRPYRELDDPLRVVGAVLETGAMHPGRSGRNHLRIVASQAGIATPRVDALLERVGLEAAARRRVRGYSLGMRQRLALATALIGDPAILILDEPANGLDPDGVRWLREFLRSLADEGRAVLVSSHGLAEFELVVDKVVVIGHGRVLADRSLHELARDTGAVEVHVSVSEPARFVGLLIANDCEVVGRDGSLIRVAGSDARLVARIAYDHAIEIDRLVVQQPSLEDAYFELAAGAEAIR